MSTKKHRTLFHLFYDIRSTFAAWLLGFASVILAVIPPALANSLARFWGWVYAICPTKDRAALIHNLCMVLPYSPKEARRVAHRIFLNFASTLYDFFHPKGIQVEVPDREKLERLRSQNNGILVLTFHMGNWELGARTMASWGWPVTAVYQPYQNKQFRRVIDKIRAPGVNFIAVGREAASGVRQAFKRGDIVAMLGDHIFGEEGVLVNLNGHQVRWPKGPLLLAVREKAPVVVAVVLRTGLRRYRAIVEDPIYPSGPVLEAVPTLIQEVVDKFARLLAAHPEQWYRFRPMHSEAKEKS